MSTRIAGFDLGLKGAISRLELLTSGDFRLINVRSWDISSVDGDDVRYWTFFDRIYPTILWADVIGYEHVQHNRGKTYVEGMRASLMIVSHMEYPERLIHGVNVATLDSFMTCDLVVPEHLKTKPGRRGVKKERSLWAFKEKYPQLVRACKNDNEVDAVWVALYLVAHLKIDDQ